MEWMERMLRTLTFKGTSITTFWAAITVPVGRLELRACLERLGQLGCVVQRGSRGFPAGAAIRDSRARLALRGLSVRQSRGFDGGCRRITSINRFRPPGSIRLAWRKGI